VRRRREAELETAFDLVPGLRPEDVAAVRAVMDGGEWQLALDTLCTQIHEDDIELTPAARRHLDRLGKKLRVPVAYLLGDPGAERPTKPWY
jgi:hypothetical protein